ncbi:hypothetical protein WJX84_011707 [Apatococcus fuscideae]|uniref:non-specific serine/threonine protein kinase n=1 Tax=Apatococcus fuscideae TaxID=2026836 RepID=A0AAW1T786_9CHLO
MEKTFASRARRPKKECTREPEKPCESKVHQASAQATPEKTAEGIAGPDAVCGGGRRPLGPYNRRVALGVHDREAASRSRYFADMKAHFEDVDSFELVEESPCPAASRHQQARSPTLLHPQRSEELQVPSETAVAAIDKSLQDRATLQDAPAAHIPLQDHETIVHETQARAQVQAPPAQQQEAASLNAAASQPGPLPGTSSLHSTEWEPREQAHPSQLSSRLLALTPPAGLAANEIPSQEGQRPDDWQVRTADVPQLLQLDPIKPTPVRPLAHQHKRSDILRDGGSPDAALRLLRPRLEQHQQQEVSSSQRSEGASAAASLQNLAAVNATPLSIRIPSARCSALRSPNRGLDMDTDALEPGPSHPTGQSSPLQQLLQLCGQAGEAGQLPTMEALLGRYVSLEGAKKLGEGTYGEAFKAGGIVFKIVPIEGACLVNGFPQTQAFQILAEASISLALSGLRHSGELHGGPTNSTIGFAETFGCGLCQGPYAPQLNAAWKKWDELHTSENDPVGELPSQQMYAAFLVADGGADLETFEVRSFEEARSILLQTTVTLAVAEEALGFEHRDLHWGNLLIKRTTESCIKACSRGVDITCQTNGVAVTLIDFTLSRLETSPGQVAFSNLSSDPELFQGPKADPQAETYRRMQVTTGSRWQDFTPKTNCLWVHYLVEILLTLKAPPGASAKDKRSLRSFRKRTLESSSCRDLLWDPEFSGLWSAGR